MKNTVEFKQTNNYTHSIIINGHYAGYICLLNPRRNEAPAVGDWRVFFYGKYSEYQYSRPKSKLFGVIDISTMKEHLINMINDPEQRETIFPCDKFSTKYYGIVTDKSEKKSFIMYDRDYGYHIGNYNTPHKDNIKFLQDVFDKNKNTPIGWDNNYETIDFVEVNAIYSTEYYNSL